MSINVANFIVEKRQELSRVKTEKDKAGGRLQSLTEKLDKDFGVSDLDKIDDEMETLQSSIGGIEKKEKVLVTKIEAYDWESV